MSKGFRITLSVKFSNQNDKPAVVEGDVIKYRGEVYDFGQLTNGAEIDVGEPFVGSIKRIDDQIQCVLQYRYDSICEQSVDWLDYVFDVESGQCPCPIKRYLAPEEVLEAENE